MPGQQDDPELQELIQKVEAMRPVTPADRERLKKTLRTIDEINSSDPNKVNIDGVPRPYRVVYSDWVLDWVNKLDPKAPDELLILAKGRSIESWKLADIKRDDYSPNAAGERQWQLDRKTWLANRLTGVMKEAGYNEQSVRFVEEVMLDRDIPDPREIRKYDLVGPLGLMNLRLLEQAMMIQTLRDADALVFMEKNFPQMFNRMTSDEVLVALKRELSKVSQKCMGILLSMKWSAVQLKLVSKAFPPPRRYASIMKEVEGMAAASTHPGDWRYRDFQYD
eukprot:CAMPEP_0202922934 /NCGR_PEP_ID=MMETSP1392-20130828/78183_1 /ASSEMBLY_ACC=CAM_ASM_000868 /TAXON_ID=225041 /ORGANISM="Chlamydomonas chlamydogama, Strain SAG 11-48b" /LENGTH=278 /DNA_ID=CAMNT_0049616589 /DNA_START=278 /DNA_END=1115 /DNA_ORIENTATION=-